MVNVKERKESSGGGGVFMVSYVYAIHSLIRSGFDIFNFMWKLTFPTHLEIKTCFYVVFWDDFIQKHIVNTDMHNV